MTETIDSTGTGFVVGERRILTANHVVEGSARVSVVIDGERLPAAVVKRDQQLDVAELSVDGGEPVDAGSALMIMTLGAGNGAQVTVVATVSVTVMDWSAASVAISRALSARL